MGLPLRDFLSPLRLSPSRNCPIYCNPSTLTREDTTVEGRLALDAESLEYGTREYAWTFTPADGNYASSSGTVEVTVTGHDWGEPTYEWSDDGTCTATRTCANDASHTETEAATVTAKVTKVPTEGEEGEAELTATFSNEAFAPQTKAVGIPRLGSSVTVRGDGPSLELSVPDGLLWSVLGDAERELAAKGAQASLVATVTWYEEGEAPEADASALSKDPSAATIGAERLMDISLSVRVGDKERRLTSLPKPVGITVNLDPDATDGASKALIAAWGDTSKELKLVVRRVHAGEVAGLATLSFAPRDEKAVACAVAFESDRFSTYSIGVAKEDEPQDNEKQTDPKDVDPAKDDGQSKGDGPAKTGNPTPKQTTPAAAATAPSGQAKGAALARTGDGTTTAWLGLASLALATLAAGTLARDPKTR